MLLIMLFLRAPAAVVVAAVILMALPGDAIAWWYVEHAEIGTNGYRRACKSVESKLPDLGTDGATEVRARFEIACGNLAIRARLYGQATALAGDRLDDPEDFLARGGDWKVGSRKHYFLLQLVDVHHFHPSSMHEWMRHHRLALSLAEAASAEQGIDAIDAYQRAFYRNAFSDHFLQDSHAAGHMGFNRSASSIAATTAYHGIWNTRGRLVQSRDGESWVTYGDSLLNDSKNRDGRSRVIQACANSAYAVIAAFVFGKRDTDHELQAWREIPYRIEASSIPALLEADGEDDDVRTIGQLRPLQAVSWPARVDAVVDLTFQFMAPLREPGSLTSAALLGFDAILPVLEIGGRISFGATTPHDELEPRLASQLELRRSLGLSIDGLLHHQIATSFLWEARTTKFAGWLSAAYILQVELGINLVLLQLGPTFDFGIDAIGYQAGVSYGRVFGVAGGGVR